MDQNNEVMQPDVPEEPDKKICDFKKNEWLEWAKAIAIGLIFAIGIRMFLFAPFGVDGSSMEPTFHGGERIIVNKFLYKFRQPKRGEIIIFRVPKENNRDLIKRVIGVSGDIVECRDDDVYVNGKKIEEPYIQAEINKAHKKNLLYNNRNSEHNSISPQKVPEGHVFVMGDNRSNSHDSRNHELGSIPLKHIIGRAEVIFFPFSSLGLVQNH